MPPAYHLPYQFVDRLTTIGLDTGAGRVSLAQYLCANPANGGNAKIAELVAHLRGQGIREPGTGKNVDGAVGDRLTRVMTGQGHPDAIVALMNFLCDAQGQLKGRPGVLGRVYEKYFRERPDQEALTMMVADRYFGLDCIGFVANYLQFIDLWKTYRPFEISMYDQVFTKNVRRLEDVGALDVIVWPHYHIGIVDWVYGMNGNRLEIDICQSSSGGPQCNLSVTLSPGGKLTAKGYTLWNIAGGNPQIPVGGSVYLMKKPDLYYQRPAMPHQSSSYPAAIGTY